MPIGLIERRSEIGYEARLRRRGIGRYFGASFLAFWLCGWLIGEAFALWVLIRGGFALLTGEPLNPGEGPIDITPAVASGTFLLIWLTFWTIGGVAAITELLRELWGEDRLVLGPDGLAVEWRAGPFRHRRTIPRTDIVAVALMPRRGALVVDTVRERVEACTLGSDAERREVASALRRELGLGEGARSVSAALPEEWVEVTTPEGLTALVPSPTTRTLQTRVTAALAIAAFGVTAVFVHGTAEDHAWLPLALIGATATIALAMTALWLGRGRNEWRIESGRIVLQRRFDESVTERFHATRLVLTVRQDSDGDDWFALEALSEADASATAAARRRNRKGWRIVHRMNDDAVPRRLGHWLAQRAGIPLDDRTAAGTQTGTRSHR